MSYERENTFPYNAGVMLIHLPEMRRTYTKFVEFILSNEQGLYFDEMGPVDQGALNKFYEHDLKSKVMSQVSM